MEILGLLDVPVWLLLLLLVSLLVYVYGTWTHSTWSSGNVPGPKPWPLTGNMTELMKKTPFCAYSDWRKKYGRVYGIYVGIQPSLVVSDLDMLREILVKRFSNFADRFITPRSIPPVIDKGLFFVGGTTWKRIRKMMTPTFTASKLRLMSYYINRCSDLLYKSIEQKVCTDQNIDLKDVFGSYTTDVTAWTAFGLETNSQTQEGEPFVMHSKKLFENAEGRFRSFIFFSLRLFPFLGPLLRSLGVTFFQSEHAQFLLGAVRQMIADRRGNGSTPEKKREDLLQTLVEAESDPEQVADSADLADDTKSHKRMTVEEIVGQGFMILMAGYETTSTTLQYLTYNLTLNPDVQEKVFEEIRDKVGNTKPTYENVSTLKYLDAAIHETLRVFPSVPVIDRRALKTTTVGGVTIPADCCVTIPIYSLMHDPELFPQPDSFIPERFLEENRAELDPLLAELPFGYGPRQCIGMRLALLEIKFAAVKLFRTFRFLKCPDTPEKITLGKATVLPSPDVPIKVKAELRAA